MSHGPTYYGSKGSCIYCGARGVKLTDEHIVPYSLGGAHVLRKASCNPCADITKKFEQKVARDLWGVARASFDAPSRRKKHRPKYLFMRDPIDNARGMTVPASEYPAGFVFYKMGRAGLLEGLPESADASKLWQMVVIDDHGRREKFHQKNPGKLVLTFRHVPNEFGRLLAKIGYCQVLTSLDLGDFRPICLPFILGAKPSVSFVVGGSLDDQRPEPECGYSLKTVAFGTRDRLMLVATIRLCANTHAPAYHAVVGDVVGSESVANIIPKLGPGDFTLLAAGSNMSPIEHWMPRTLPLPFWSSSVGPMQTLFQNW